jgi:hypothetical protein
MYLSTWLARGESIGKGVAEKGPKGKCLEMNEEGGKRDGKLAGEGEKRQKNGAAGCSFWRRPNPFGRRGGLLQGSFI